MPQCTRQEEISKIADLEKGQRKTQHLLWFSIVLGLGIEIVKGFMV